MKLILNGGGSGELLKDSYELFSKLVDGGKVLYIPLAWENGNIEDCINWFKNEMSPFGVTNIVQVLDAVEITKELLETIKGVFIGGGNTFKLLKMLKETPAFENLKEFLDGDGVIMGSSAGSLIFGQDINTCLKDELEIKSCNDENLVNLVDTTGFDCLKGYSFFSHYKKYEEQIANTEKRLSKLINKSFKIVAVPEESSLYLNNQSMSIVGPKPAEIVTKEKRIILNPNETFELV